MAVGVSSVADSVVALSAVVGEFLEGSWAGLGDAGVLEVARRVETARRRLEAFDARLMAELDERGVAGQRLAPVRAVLAAARAEGAVSGQHVQVILRALDKIPASVAVSQVEQAEAFLVERARVHDPAEVAGLGRMLVETLHPEAVLVAEAARRRWLACGRSGMGWSRFGGSSMPGSQGGRGRHHSG
jgi:hypothetical protein